MKDRRPVNLDLTKFSFPCTAIASILHRISGVILFLLIPLALWALDRSLGSMQGFQAMQSYFMNPITKIAFWILLAALLYHLVAGIRHLLMDMGIGESLQVGRFSAYLVMVLGIVLIILAGIWLW